MPVYQESDSAWQLVPEGDYVLAVYEFTSDISTGKKTSGSKRYNIVFNIEGTESRVQEQLIDHESCAWKISQFIRACGIRNLQEKQAFQFEPDVAEETGEPWINPMGLRCHAAIMHETYTSSRGNEVTKNKIAAFYTDRDPLPPDPVLRKKPVGGSEF